MKFYYLGNEAVVADLSSSIRASGAYTRDVPMEGAVSVDFNKSNEDGSRPARGLRSIAFKSAVNDCDAWLERLNDVNQDLNHVVGIDHMNALNVNGQNGVNATLPDTATTRIPNQKANGKFIDSEYRANNVIVWSKGNAPATDEEEYDLMHDNINAPVDFEIREY